MTFKVRLVYNQSQVDPRDLSIRATVVKTISFRLLDLIADTQAHEVLYGDIGNAFQDKTKEKIYTRVGKEFGDRTESIALITHSLCGLMISTEMFRTLFAGFFRTLGFHPIYYQ